MEYRYNENGLRSLKRIYNADWSDSDDYYYFWSDDGRLLAYTVDLIGSEDPYSVLVLYNSDKEPIGFTVEDDTYYYLKNIQGDVLCVTDAEGTPIVNYTYDAWGAMTITPASQNVPSATVVTVAFLNPVTYRGYFYDYELGLYYLQSRYYDPEIGRFVSADVFIDTGKSIVSPNTFIYCDNNPVYFVDYTGNFSIRKTNKGLAVENAFWLGFSNEGGWFKTPWTTTVNCIQRQLGYCDLYDRAAFMINCHIDCLISEFTYSARNWRVEFWKGQYLLNRGAEIGLYYRDENCRLSKKFYICPQRKDTLFDMRFVLYEAKNKDKNNLSEILRMDTSKEKHWWLTGFLYERFRIFKGNPGNLVLDASVTFYDSQMASGFYNNLGQEKCDGAYCEQKNNENLAEVRVVWAYEVGEYQIPGEIDPVTVDKVKGDSNHAQ